MVSVRADTRGGGGVWMGSGECEGGGWGKWWGRSGVYGEVGAAGAGCRWWCALKWREDMIGCEMIEYERLSMFYMGGWVRLLEGPHGVHAHKTSGYRACDELD